MTMTTSAGIRMDSPMPTCTATSGPMSAPASAARAAPEHKNAAKDARDAHPHQLGHPAVGRAARTSMPTRLWLTSRYSSSATSTPAPSTSSR